MKIVWSILLLPIVAALVYRILWVLYQPFVSLFFTFGEGEKKVVDKAIWKIKGPDDVFVQYGQSLMIWNEGRPVLIGYLQIPPWINWSRVDNPPFPNKRWLLICPTTGKVRPMQHTEFLENWWRRRRVAKAKKAA